MCLWRYNNQTPEDIAEDIKLTIKYLDAGKVLGFVGTLAEDAIKFIKGRPIKKMLEDEDTKLFIQSKIRLLGDFLEWPVNLVREIIGA